MLNLIFALALLFTSVGMVCLPAESEARTRKSSTASELKNPTPKPTPWRRTKQNDKKYQFYQRYFRKGKEVKKKDDLATTEKEREIMLKKILPIHTPTPEEDRHAKEIRKLIHDLGTEHHRRQTAIERLVMLGEPAVPALRKTLGHTYKFKRVGALQALGYIHSKAAIPDIQNLLGDKELVVRLEAIKVLGRMKHKASVPKLIKRLEDPDKRICREVVTALGRIKTPAAIQGLIRALGHAGPEIRLLACDELSFFAGEKVVIALLSTTRNEDQDVRIAAIRALGEIGDPLARPRLKELTKNENHMIRQEALQALNNIQ